MPMHVELNMSVGVGVFTTHARDVSLNFINSIRQRIKVKVNTNLVWWIR